MEQRAAKPDPEEIVKILLFFRFLKNIGAVPRVKIRNIQMKPTIFWMITIKTQTIHTTLVGHKLAL